MKTKSGDVSKGVPSKEETSQTRSLDPNPSLEIGDVKIKGTQLREVGMFEKSSDFDNLDQPNPFVGMGSNPAVSDRQQKFMGMCAHNPGKARGRCPSKAVAEEFEHRG